MLKEFLCSKIHRATITDSNLEYVGSITIDEELIEKAGTVPCHRKTSKILPGHYSRGHISIIP